eukprot:TRINITY_DN1539_c0_g1_i1.p1 TRINITY_DN1539_c0_g1~~TRINITY_DN1539_c0_g1_i1.p1  ORF type:complete len:525 (-),score=114.10 TRINITY_DN1539_c0_g1_i1:25-1599(-)
MSNNNNDSVTATTTTTTAATLVERRYDVYHAAFIHAPSLSEVEVVKKGWLVVESTTGLIEFVAKELHFRSSGAIDPERPAKQKGPVDPSNEATKPQDVLKDDGNQRSYVEQFIMTHIEGVSSLDEAIRNKKVILHDYINNSSASSVFLIPGFIDCHAHAPQYAQMGTGLDLPLLKWLNYYTFPLESRFRDTAFAREVYTKAIRRFLRHGTTTCVWFGTIHNPANKVLVEVIRDLGQRAFVGKVCMNRNAPDFLLDASAEESLSQTAEFADYVLREVRSPLITPIVTPRFAPACTEDLLISLGALAKQKDIPIQSHLSENKDEVKWIKEVLFPGKKYSQVYDDCGLLTHKTIMAHCVFLDDQEVDLLKDRGVGVAHCPISNYVIHSGEMRAREYLNKGLKVGLGTDVSAGTSPGILPVLRQTIIASNALDFEENPKPSNSPPLGYQEAFALATLGGARVIGYESKLGNFEVGKYFDAICVDASSENSPFDVFQDIDTTLDVFQKFLMVGDDRNMSKVFVAGRQVI